MLFSERDQQVLRLDEASSCVWHLLFRHSVPFRFLDRAFADHYSCTLAVAGDYIDRCISGWLNSNIVEVDHPSEKQEPSTTHSSRPSVSSRPSSPPRGEHGSEDSNSIFFSVCAHTVALNVGNEAQRLAALELLGHLVTESSAADFELPPFSDATDARADALSAFVCWIKTAVMEDVLAINPGWMALHAGALSTPHGCVLLAGKSGSGKTTLGAILNSRGFASLADDVVFVDEAKTTVTGLPFAYCAKNASWPILARHGLISKNRNFRIRPDGREVIYIAPLSVALSGDVRLIVFPDFKCGSAASSSEVDKDAALIALLSDARNHERRLTTRGFLTLCRILENARTIRISYDDADRAADLIHGLLLS